MHVPAVCLPTSSRGLCPQRRVSLVNPVRRTSRMGRLEQIPTERRVESFADDLNTRLGIVSGRVALLPRSTEIQPLSLRFVPPTSLIKTHPPLRTGTHRPTRFRFHIKMPTIMPKSEKSKAVAFVQLQTHPCQPCATSATRTRRAQVWALMGSLGPMHATATAYV